MANRCDDAPAGLTSSLPDDSTGLSAAEQIRALAADNARLKARLEEAEDTLQALRNGEVDAIVIAGNLFTLDGAEAASNRFRGDALAQMEDAVVAIDNERRVTYLNPAAERLYGQGSSQVLGRTLDRLYTQRWLSEADAAAASAVAAAAAEHQVWRGRILHRRADGTELRVESALSALRDRSGTVIGALAVARDVTEQAKAEAAALAREHFINRVVAVAPGVLYVFDVIERRSVFISDSIQAVLGRSSAEIAAMGAALNERLLHPDDRAAFKAHRARVRSAVDGEVMTFEHRLRHADGRWLWFESRDTVFSRTEAGAVQQVIGTATDITDTRLAVLELARREREFVMLVENSPDVVVRFDADLRHSYVSPAVERYVGFPAARFIGKTNLELGMPAELSAHWDKVLTEVIRSGQLRRIAFQFTTPTGDLRHLDARLIPQLAADGSVESVLSVATDVTDRARAEEALREADRRKDEFLATLAHELRNPLAPVVNALAIMRISKEPSAHERLRLVIERQIGQLVHLVDDLLDVSRISQGKLDLRKEVLDVSTVIRNAVETGRPLIEGRSHLLTLDFPPRPLFVAADMTRLTQVFANILNNAAKYTPEGGRIDVEVRRDGSDAVVEIQDNGIGIEPHLLGDVFEMFTQVGGPLARPQSGLGIGLALVRRLVALHDGSVAAHSTGRGHGLRVTVRLPVAAVNTAAAASGSKDPAAAAAGAARRPLRRVLVADDNADNAETLSAMLRLIGCQTVIARDGREAVELARSFRPEIAMLDIGMPKLDGNAAARRIRAEPWGEDITLIAISGWGQLEDRRETAAAGFDHHVVKPVDPALLQRMIQERRGA